MQSLVRYAAWLLGAAAWSPDGRPLCELSYDWHRDSSLGGPADDAIFLAGNRITMKISDGGGGEIVNALDWDGNKVFSMRLRLLHVLEHASFLGVLGRVRRGARRARVPEQRGVDGRGEL